MLDGIELEEKITKEKANWLLTEFNLEVIKPGGLKYEKRIKDNRYSYLRKGKYQCMIIEVERKGDEYTLTIRGSLHKFYHGNNKGNFWGYEILNAIDILCTTFKINKFQTKVLNLEIGVNIFVWFENVYLYLKSNLIQHKKKPFYEPDELSKKGLISKHDDYFNKFYSKDKSLLRYEIKHTSSVDLANRYRITFLSDLDSDTLFKMAVNLMDEFKEVVMQDGINILDKANLPGGMTIREREKLLEFSSSFYQNSYKEKLKVAVTGKKKVSLRQKSYRLKTDCLKLIKKYGNGDHQRLHLLIADHVGEFINSWNEIKAEPVVNVTNSPINKKWDNVTKGSIDIILIQNRNKPLIQMINTIKSKKQVAKEKREQSNKQFKSFISALTLTLERSTKKAA